MQTGVIFHVLGALYAILGLYGIVASIHSRFRILPVVRHWYLPDSSAANRVRSRCHFLFLLAPFSVLRTVWAVTFGTYCDRTEAPVEAFLVTFLLYGVAYWIFLIVKCALALTWIYTSPKIQHSLTEATKFRNILAIIGSISGIMVLTTFVGCALCATNDTDTVLTLTNLWTTEAVHTQCYSWAMGSQLVIVICSTAAALFFSMAGIWMHLSVIEIVDDSSTHPLAAPMRHSTRLLIKQRQYLKLMAVVCIFSFVLRASFQIFLSVPSGLKSSISGDLTLSNFLVTFELFLTEVLPLIALVLLLHLSIIQEHDRVLRESTDVQELYPK